MFIAAGVRKKSQQRLCQSRGYIATQDLKVCSGVVVHADLMLVVIAGLGNLWALWQTTA